MSSIQKLLRKVQSNEGMPTPWTEFELYRYVVSHTYSSCSVWSTYPWY